MPSSSLRIDILGTSISVSADEELAYLESLLNQYYIAVENTRKVTGVSDPLKLAIMTGYLLCDDIQKCRKNLTLLEHYAAESRETERIFLDISTRIDEVLDKRNWSVHPSDAEAIPAVETAVDSD
jgi:cell division protein ZapA (FtsZ GTPase activity inhibitor)